MPNFESGVSRYITGTYTVKVHFPVDHKGNADISCNQCPYYSQGYRKCRLNDQIVAYPEHFVGYYCPLETEEENGDTQ